MIISGPEHNDDAFAVRTGKQRGRAARIVDRASIRPDVEHEPAQVAPHLVYQVPYRVLRVFLGLHRDKRVIDGTTALDAMWHSPIRTVQTYRSL
jgi:hypothetical protein